MNNLEYQGIKLLDTKWGYAILDEGTFPNFERSRPSGPSFYLDPTNARHP